MTYDSSTSAFIRVHLWFHFPRPSVSKNIRSRQAVEVTGGFAHDTGAQGGREGAGGEVRRVAVPVREVAGEHQHPAGVEHLQDLPQVRRVRRLLQRLRGEE